MLWRGGAGQGRATPLSVGECPAQMEKGDESNSSQVLYSSTVFLKSFPAMRFRAAELDGRESVRKATKAKGLSGFR